MRQVGRHALQSAWFRTSTRPALCTIQRQRPQRWSTKALTVECDQAAVEVSPEESRIHEVGDEYNIHLTCRALIQICPVEAARRFTNHCFNPLWISGEQMRVSKYALNVSAKMGSPLVGSGIEVDLRDHNATQKDVDAPANEHPSMAAIHFDRIRIGCAQCGAPLTQSQPALSP